MTKERRYEIIYHLNYFLEDTIYNTIGFGITNIVCEELSDIIKLEITTEHIAKLIGSEGMMFNNITKYLSYKLGKTVDINIVESMLWKPEGTTLYTKKQMFKCYLDSFQNTDESFNNEIDGCYNPIDTKQELSDNFETFLNTL